MNTKPRKSERGTAMIMVTVMAMVVSGMIAAMFILTQNAAQQTERQLEREEATVVAETALNLVVEAICAHDPSGGGWVDVGLDTGSSDTRTVTGSFNGQPYTVQVRSAYLAHQAGTCNADFLQPVSRGGGVYDVYEIVAISGQRQGGGWDGVGREEYVAGVRAVIEVPELTLKDQLLSPLYIDSDPYPDFNGNAFSVSGEDHDMWATKESGSFRMPYDGEIEIIYEPLGYAGLRSSFNMLDPVTGEEVLIFQDNAPGASYPTDNRVFTQEQALNFYIFTQGSAWGIGDYVHHSDPDHINGHGAETGKPYCKTYVLDPDGKTYLTDGRSVEVEFRDGDQNVYEKGTDNVVDPMLLDFDTALNDYAYENADGKKVVTVRMGFEDLPETYKNNKHPDWDYEDVVVKMNIIQTECDTCGGRGFLECAACAAGAECPTCNNTGGVNCGTCNGAGDQLCTTCAGTGGQTCATCGGDGDVACDNCGGNGWYVAKNGKVRDCNDCNGTGREICPDCAGAGDFNCPDCGGDGRTDCPDCADGTHTCPTCNGASGQDPANCQVCGGDGRIDCPDCNVNEVVDTPWYEMDEIDSLTGKPGKPAVASRPETVLNDGTYVAPDELGNYTESTLRERTLAEEYDAMGVNANQEDNVRTGLNGFDRRQVDLGYENINDRPLETGQAAINQSTLNLREMAMEFVGGTTDEDGNIVLPGESGYSVNDLLKADAQCYDKIGNGQNHNDIGTKDDMKITYINGDAGTLAGQVEGGGVMVINGDCHISGKWAFAGVVIVLGDLKISGGGNGLHMLGSILVQGECTVTGNADIWWSEKAVEAVDDLTNYPARYRYYPKSWRALDKGELEVLGY